MSHQYPQTAQGEREVAVVAVCNLFVKIDCVTKVKKKKKKDHVLCCLFIQPKDYYWKYVSIQNLIGVNDKEASLKYKLIQFFVVSVKPMDFMSLELLYPNSSPRLL